MSLAAPASKRRRVQTTLRSGVAVLLAAAAWSACAQGTGNPGDIIVEREVMPRDAFNAVPRNENPVAVRAATFPAPTFDATVATLVSDADLTRAHGSQGIAGAGSSGSTAGLQALAKLLGGSATGSNVAMGAGGLAPSTKGVGGTVSLSVTGALAPLGAGLAGLGGLK